MCKTWKDSKKSLNRSIQRQLGNLCSQRCSRMEFTWILGSKSSQPFMGCCLPGASMVDWSISETQNRTAEGETEARTASPQTSS
jgi:hypothetical protein